MSADWPQAGKESPGFCPGERVASRVLVDGTVTLPLEAQSCAGDVLLVEEDPGRGTRLHSWTFASQAEEHHWDRFGLRLGPGGNVELWVRGGGSPYGSPYDAGHRIAILHPGQVIRVIHSVKAAAGAAHACRWSEFLFEPLGVPRQLRFGEIRIERTLPLEQAQLIDLREYLL
jgi:hypothetical protein